MRRNSCIAALLILCMTASNGLAQTKPLELKWSELAPLISAQTVELTMTGGATLKGEVVAVREDGLVMDVNKTSDAKAYPKGNGTIPRSSLTTLRLIRTRGKWGRSLGTTLGVVTGLTLGGYTAIETADSAGAGIAVFLAIAGAMSVAGYFVGRSADRRVTEIRIVP